MIARRAFIAGTGAALSMIAMAPGARAARRPRVIGLVFTTIPVAAMRGDVPPHASTREFLAELRALGYAERDRIAVERRSAEGRVDQYPRIVAELVSLPVDVIVVAGSELAAVVKSTTGSVPCVAAFSSDPVADRLVETLARPGANLTGLTADAGPAIEAKRMQLLHELMPKASRIGYLCPQGGWESANGHSARRAAAELGLELRLVEYVPRDLDAGLKALREAGTDCVLAARHPTNVAVRERVAAFALEQKMPLLGPSQEFAAAGALLSYGPSILGLWRQLAGLTARVLEGAAPGDVPVQQPTKFEMLVNLRTARQLGIEVPPSILIRADEVIE